MGDDLVKYSREGNFEKVKELLTDGISTDIDVRDGYTVLDIALRRYHRFDIVKILLDSGLDINYHNCNYFPLRFASSHGDLEVVKYLINNGIDIHVDNDIALWDAAKNGHLEVVKLLVENGADIHARNGVDSSPIRATLENDRLYTYEDKRVLTDALTECKRKLEVLNYFIEKM